MQIKKNSSRNAARTIAATRCVQFNWMNKQTTIILIILSLMFSCKTETKNDSSQFQNVKKINKTIIQFFPSFNLPSLIICDLNNQEIIFQRLGNKTHLEVTPLPEGKVIETRAPLSCAFNIDSASYTFLMDSIINKLNENDFHDLYEEANDGTRNSIVYIFSDSTFTDIELNNSFTNNHLALFNFLLAQTIKNHNDSASIDYLKTLKKYY